MAKQRPDAAAEPAAARSGDADDAKSRWPQTTGHCCSLAGCAGGLYLSAVDISSAVPLYCAENGVINCAPITTSPSSIVLGVSVAYYGAFWFGVMALLLVVRHRAAPRCRLVWFTTISALFGRCPALVERLQPALDELLAARHEGI